MHINTTARHFELSQDDRAFAHMRLEKFRRFAPDLHEVHLVITAENYRYTAEATLRLKQRELAVREEATDPRLAIDRLSDRVEAQLRRIHDKRVDHKRAPGAQGIELPQTDSGDDDEPEAAAGGEG